MGDACITGNNGKSDQQSGNSSGYDDTGTETGEAQKHLLKHGRNLLCVFLGSSMSEYKIFMQKIIKNKNICTFSDLSSIIKNAIDSGVHAAVFP